MIAVWAIVALAFFSPCAVSAAAEGVSVRGSLDDITGAPGCRPPCGAAELSVQGWAVDTALSGGRTPVNVSILIDGQVVATGVASKPRPDLVKAGVAPDPDHGFLIQLPPAAVERLGPAGARHSLHAHVGKTVLTSRKCDAGVHCGAPAKCVDIPQQDCAAEGSFVCMSAAVGSHASKPMHCGAC
jgi:hypothetical protein